MDDIVNEDNNIYHRLIKLKPTDVEDNTYINSIKDVNDKDARFQVDDHARISKHKNFFAKPYTPN